MKQTLTTLLALILSINLYAQVGSFATKKSLGNDLVSREDAGVVYLNNKLYIQGGYCPTSPNDFVEYNLTTGVTKNLARFLSPTKKNLFEVNGKIYSFGNLNYVYDTLANSWTALPASPTGMGMPDAGFVLNDTIYLVAGSGNLFYSYNVVTNTYTQKANLPGNARWGTIAFDINGKGYWGTGYWSPTWYNDFYEYDPALNTWTAKASLPVGFRSGSGIGLNGKGYAGLGNLQSGLETFSWYEFDPIANTWTQKQNGLAKVRSASPVCIGNEIFLLGGLSDFGGAYLQFDDLLKYNPGTNAWSLANAEIGQNRTQAAGFYLNGKIYVGGGHDWEPLKDFWEYDIANDQWTEKAPFYSNYFMRACAEVNGKGYFLGGYKIGDPQSLRSDSLVEYNPVTNQWTTKAAIPGGGRQAAVALSYNNQLYAGMGSNQFGHYKNDFYSYNPNSNSWTALANSPITTAEGPNHSYFVLGDTAYVITTSYVHKYSFLNNSWTSILLTPINNIYALYYTNQAFVFNGKGYLVYAESGSGDKLAEYNPATGLWNQILNLPFSTESQLIVPTPSGVYFGFGENNPNKHSNEFRKLRFNAEVSDNSGVFSSLIASQNDYLCGSGALANTASHSVYDTLGNLFSTVYYTGNLVNSSGCHEVNSLPTNQPYREHCGNFGHGFNENGLFLNKSILFNNGGLPNNGKLRLYYTTTELQNFVQDFNAQYNSNKTVDSIKILQYNQPSIDNDPLNNTGPNSGFTLRTPVWASYANGRYAEITSLSASPILGELYAVLSAGSPSRTQSESQCDTYTFQSQTFTTSGTYPINVPNTTGCDSIITLVLDIRNSSTSSLTQLACGTYTLNGQTYTASNTYTQTLTNSVGCDSTLTLNLTINTVDTSVTVVEPIITANEVGASYQWLDCNNANLPIANETNQSYTVLGLGGTYSVIVTANGCTDTSNCRLVMITVVSGSVIEKGFEVYPNPASTVITIATNTNLLGSDYSVIDQFGKFVLEGKLSAVTTSVDVSELAAGLYAFKVGGHTQKTFNVIKK